MKNTVGFKKRLLAFIVDKLIATVILLFVFQIVVVQNNIHSILTALVFYLAFSFIVYPIANILVTHYLTSKFGGSLGKIITGIKVTDLKGNNISFKRSFFRREIGYPVSYIAFGLGFLWIARDDKNQAFHDQIAETYVINSRKNGGMTGVVSIIIFLVMLAAITSNLLNSALQNSTVYQDMINDIESELYQQFPKIINPQIENKSNNFSLPVQSPATTPRYQLESTPVL